MKHLLSLLLVPLLAASCAGSEERKEREEAEESRYAVRLLQGIWLDDNTEVPVLKVKGDSMYLASRMNEPFFFTVSGDTLEAHGAERVAYLINYLKEQRFSFYTSTGDLIALHKADNDTLAFGFETPPAPKSEVVKKDKICMFGGKRYHGYAYINPSTRKVVRPALTEEGMTVDNIYYDNVIHICVYEGKRRLYGKDITKDMFAGVVPDSFLGISILSDMDFVRVDEAGYRYRATVCAPDGTSCYYVDMLVDREGKLSCRLSGGM